MTIDKLIAHAYGDCHEELARELAKALESDRALLRRIVEAWDRRSEMTGRSLRGCASYEFEGIIDEARARIGEGK